MSSARLQHGRSHGEVVLLRRWFLAGDDGIVSTSNQGLGSEQRHNPATGEPAFTHTLAQEQENGGFPAASTTSSGSPT
jgi:hypothetical protein